MLRLWYPLPKNQHTFLQRFTLFKKIEDFDEKKINSNFLWKKISEGNFDPEHSELLNILKTLQREHS